MTKIQNSTNEKKSKPSNLIRLEMVWLQNLHQKITEIQRYKERTQKIKFPYPNHPQLSQTFLDLLISTNYTSSIKRRRGNKEQRT